MSVIILFFHQMIVHKKLYKNYEKCFLFHLKNSSFSRFFCISVFLSFFPVGRCFRCDVHTQFVTLNFKMTTPPLKASGVTSYFFCCKVSYIDNGKQDNWKRPTYYTMALYSTKIENIAIKIKSFTFISQMTLQAGLSISSVFYLWTLQVWRGSPFPRTDYEDRI